MAVLTPTQALQLDTARLEGLLASRMLSIGYLDPEGQLVQWLETDPALAELVADHYRRRIQQLAVQEQGIAQSYPVLPD